MVRQIGVVAMLFSAALAFGCQKGSSWDICSEDWECGDNERCIGGECRPWTSDDGGPGDADTADADTVETCRSNADCDGGFCVGDRCCPTSEQVCGESCCELYETCFAQACVVPGAICHSTYDCEEGQYCELAFGEEGEGEGDAGVDGSVDGGTDGGTCLYPTPSSGRCLDLPPDCPEGVRPDEDRVCIPECEYRPPVGQLRAEMRWRWGPEAEVNPNRIDVWNTPVVGRVTDTNCDGEVNELDPPNVIFVSGNVRETCCSCGDYVPSTCLTGALRVLDGLTGREVWTSRFPSEGSIGFAGIGVAIGHLLDEGGLEGGATTLDIAAVTGEGRLVVLNSEGEVVLTSEERLPTADISGFGWGGGLAIADMNGDGRAEIAYANAVFTVYPDRLERIFVGEHGAGGNNGNHALSTFADLDGAPDGHLELLAGNTAYTSTGETLWYRSDLGDGFSATGDFNRDGLPEAVLVVSGQVLILDGATGDTVLGPTVLPSDGHGGAPTVADFDGDGLPEIGVAQKSYYTMLDPQLTMSEVGTEWISLDIAWQATNHDLSSSVTGSTVFDFEGDGTAEVIYNDECFLWVYDGPTGAVRYATPTTSFTGTEASLVADVDGDGHAEMLMISNGASPDRWHCNESPWTEPDPETGRPAWAPPEGETAWRGVTLWGDRANSWVGTRTLWNQATYHVSNICDHRDDACDEPTIYGAIPRNERPNWMVPWLNNFRQNVQDEGIYDAPDATLGLEVLCTTPPELHAYLRNLGAAVLPAGVTVAFSVVDDDTETLLGEVVTDGPIYPGGVRELVFTPAAEAGVTTDDIFRARIIIDAEDPLFHECDEENNQSALVTATCLN